jgi:hypothetical protein
MRAHAADEMEAFVQQAEREAAGLEDGADGTRAVFCLECLQSAADVTLSTLPLLS